MMWMNHGDIHAAFNSKDTLDGEGYNVKFETKEAYETELLELLGDGVGGKIGHLRPNLGLDLETGSVLTVYTSTGTPKIR